uniref:Uncharacterized protein n=1 Tax=Anguilla anguilla TaxID=7936 RepID=A0A0E9R0D7_ANGAN
MIKMLSVQLAYHKKYTSLSQLCKWSHLISDPRRLF